MNKLLKLINNMSKGKKIYSVLWIASGIFLISLIGMFVGFTNTIKEKNQKPYNVSIVAPLLKNDPNAMKYEIKATEKGDVVGIDGTKFTIQKDDFVPITKVANIYDYKSYFGDLSAFKYRVNSTGTEKESKDSLFKLEDKSALTSKAKEAQNSIAAVAFVFLILLSGSVITTAVVSKKEKGGKK